MASVFSGITERIVRKLTPNGTGAAGQHQGCGESPAQGAEVPGPKRFRVNLPTIILVSVQDDFPARFLPPADTQFLCVRWGNLDDRRDVPLECHHDHAPAMATVRSVSTARQRWLPSWGTKGGCFSRGRRHLMRPVLQRLNGQGPAT